MNIPSELEKLILTGKAEADELMIFGGAFFAWNINPDKIVIIYGITVYPFVENERNKQVSPVTQLFLNSAMSRQSYMMRASWDGAQNPYNGPYSFPCYSFHRDKLTATIVRIDDPTLWTVGNAVIRPAEKAPAIPFGPTGLNATETIDLEAGVPFTYNAFPDPVNATPGANNYKPDSPIDANTIIGSVYTQSGGFMNFPIIYLHCVFANSGNFSKILSR